jgi:hypothetical protein
MTPALAARNPGAPQIRKTLARAGAYGGTVPIGTHRPELVGRGRHEVGINVGSLAPLTSCAAGHRGMGCSTAYRFAEMHQPKRVGEQRQA